MTKTLIVLKGGVTVTFSGGCLYSKPPLYRYKSNDSQEMCTYCAFSAVVPGQQWGHVYTFSLFRPGFPIIK